MIRKYHFFGEINEWKSFLKKHKHITSVSKTNYINNKLLDVADCIGIPQDRVYKHQAVVFCTKDSVFDPKIHE